MAQALADESKDLIVRQAAGLVLKNCLSAKDPARQAELSQAWLATEATGKGQIKSTVLGALASSQAFRPPPPISPICRTPLFPYLTF